MSDFPITLAFPPQGHWTQPHLALPCIAAWLEQEGFANVEQLDLSIEAYDHFLSPEYLTTAKARVQERLPFAGLDEREELPFAELAGWRAAVESEVSADALIARIDDAKAIVRGERFWNADEYIPATRTLYHGLRLVSAAHFPSQLTPHNFTMGYANDRSQEVLRATRDRDTNPFIAFFEEQVLPRFIERKPRLVGLSVVYGSQLIPALTLGRMIKEALPDCHVTAGGGFLAYIGKKLMGTPDMAECLDSIIFHEGEAPMAALATALEAGSELHDVGSLTWFDRSSGTPRAIANMGMHPVKLDDAPAPVFDGLPLDKYLSPELVLPYDINRGCYYGECTFCTLPTVIGPGYRTREAATIAKDTIALKERYGTSHFNYITDCMPPGMIKDLPDELIARDAGVTWWADARIEPKAYTEGGAQLLYDSGCRKLLFGFETATPRLLKLMKKGQSLKSVAEVATNCSKANISVTFYAMVGFPSETRAEARDSLNFILQHSGVVREVSLQTFHIDEVAATYHEPEQFGIEILDDPDADLQLYHDYKSEVGMTQEEAAEMFEELMTGFRDQLPIFSGDNIYYFMQKSHYFLHLARGTTPDEFVERCSTRTATRAARGAEPGLRPRADLASVSLPFSYTEAVRKLSHPLARAARPDFLTGRFVADAQAEAERRIGALAQEPRVVVYDGDSAEFVELRPDGLRVLDALRSAGSLGDLLDTIEAEAPGAERLREFAGTLHRHGLLTSPS